MSGFGECDDSVCVVCREAYVDRDVFSDRRVDYECFVAMLLSVVCGNSL